MYQSLPAPKVSLAVCVPAAGTIVPGWPPVIRPTTASSPAGTAAVVPPVGVAPDPLSTTAWSSGAVVGHPAEVGDGLL